MPKIFIDGSAGTTGLRIRERLAERKDIEIITIPEELRKDLCARKDALNSADIAFLCLPDDAAREAVQLIENTNTAVIDTSTAHRTLSDWSYGFPELFGKRAEIASSKRVANPGCHASGFIALVAPLISAGIINENANLSCFSLTGYSGGGKKMIADYENPERAKLLSAPRQYALSQSHKHLPEMAKISGLDCMPVFCPIVGDFYSGMEVTVSLFTSDIRGNMDDIKEIYKSTYTGNLVHFCESPDEGGFLSAAVMSGYDDMLVSVYGNSDRIILTSLFDNLGKGASGAAIQNMNIMLGIKEDTGLNISSY